MNTTNTKENLQAIKAAMQQIKPVDRSDYFANYYSEVLARLADIERNNNSIANKILNN